MDNVMAAKLIEEVRRHVLHTILTQVANAGLSFEMREKARKVEVRLTARKSTRAGVWKRRIVRNWLGERSFEEYIEMNTALCNTEERFRTTLLHEFSHALVTWSGKRDNHGPFWMSWQIKLGADPRDVTHDYDMDEAFAARGGYYKHVGCNRGHVVKVTPYKAAQCRKRSYICVTCRSEGFPNNRVSIVANLITKGE